MYYVILVELYDAPVFFTLATFCKRAVFIIARHLRCDFATSVPLPLEKPHKTEANDHLHLIFDQRNKQTCTRMANAPVIFPR